MFELLLKAGAYTVLSLVPSSNTLSTSTIRIIQFPTHLRQRNILRSSGSHSRSRVGVQWKQFTSASTNHLFTGQAPYFGQATWFARFHPEKIQSAIDRYTNEILRVDGVLEDALGRNGTGWLVGDKCTYADLAFVTWSAIGEGLLKQLGKYEGFEEKFPKYIAWLKRIQEREDVKKILARMAQGRADHGLP